MTRIRGVATLALLAAIGGPRARDARDVVLDLDPLKSRRSPPRPLPRQEVVVVAPTPDVSTRQSRRREARRVAKGYRGRRR